MISSYRKPQGGKLPNQLLPRTRRRGAAGGDRRRDAGRAHPAGHAPPTWRGGARYGCHSHQDTGTQTTDQHFTCVTLPNHALPLAHFGAYPAYMTAAWCEPTTIMLVREVGAPSNTTRRPSMQLLVAGKAHRRSGTFHSTHIDWSEQREASYLMAYTSNHALG
jgi:hypothetical protein